MKSFIKHPLFKDAVAGVVLILFGLVVLGWAHLVGAPS